MVPLAIVVAVGRFDGLGLVVLDAEDELAVVHHVDVPVVIAAAGTGVVVRAVAAGLGVAESDDLAAGVGVVLNQASIENVCGPGDLGSAESPCPTARRTRSRSGRRTGRHALGRSRLVDAGEPVAGDASAAVPPVSFSGHRNEGLSARTACW